MILLFFARDFFLNFFLFLYRNKITAHQQQNDGRLVELFQEKDVNNAIKRIEEIKKIQEEEEE